MTAPNFHLSRASGDGSGPPSEAIPSREAASTCLSHLLGESQALRSELGEAGYQEILSLRRESDPELQGAALLRLADRLADQDHLDWALKIYEGLQVSAPDSAPPDIGRKAEARERALLGQGATGSRLEFLLKRFAKDATDYRTVLPMMAGAFVGQIAETVVLGRLAGTARSGWMAARWAPRLAAAGAGYVPEALAFGLLNRALAKKSEGSLLEDLERSALSVGALKVAGYFGKQTLLKLPVLNQIGLANQFLVPQLALFSGMWISHQLEERLGLRPKVDNATFVMDTLTAMLGVSVGSRLGHAVLGQRFASLKNELGIRAESVPTPPDENRSVTGAPLPAYSGALPPGDRSSLPPRVFMMSVGDSGDSGGVPEQGRELRDYLRLQSKVQGLLEKAEDGDLDAEVQLWKLELGLLKSRVREGYPDAIELLESLYLAGHPQALRPLCEALPRYALTEIMLAEAGERKSKRLVLSMDLEILINAAEEPKNLDHREALLALSRLAKLGRREAETALHDLFEYNISVAVEMSGMPELRRFLPNVSLRALAGAAQDRSHPFHGKAAHVLVRFLKEETPPLGLSMALAEAWDRSPEILRAAFRSQSEWSARLFDWAKEGDKASCFLLRAVAERNATLRNRVEEGLLDWGIPSIPNLEEVRDPKVVLVRETLDARMGNPEPPSWPLERDGLYTLGRAPAGEGSIAVPDRRVARSQAVLRKQGYSYWLRSLAQESEAFSSQQGTWLELEPGLWRQLKPNQELVLEVGGRFAFGLVNSELGLKEALVFSLTPEGRLESEGELAELLPGLGSGSPPDAPGRN